MSNMQNTSGSFRFESLPPEIMNKVFGDLLNPSNAPIPDVKYHCQKAWPVIQCKPALETAILRSNKGMMAMAKSYLDVVNKWVIFDIENIHLLMNWACHTVPMIVVDPDANYAVPQGIMHVRVKLFQSEMSEAFHGDLNVPASIPKRQLVVVQLEHFEAFLGQLRVMELANGVRVRPGQVFNGANQVQVTAMKGFHGLSIRVDVNPEYPSHRMQLLLEYFRMFYGPLNDISIVGSSDTQQARSIETSITLLRNTEDQTLYEAMVHVVKFIKVANGCAADGRWALAYPLYIHILSLLKNMQRSHYPSVEQRRFVELIGYFALFNFTIVLMQKMEICYYESVQEIMTVVPVTLALRLRFRPNISIEMTGWVDLLVGLFSIFMARIHDTFIMGSERLDLIRRGITTIDNTIGTFEHLPEGDTVFFREALAMCTHLQSYDWNIGTAMLVQDIEDYYKKFSNLIEQQKLPFQWCVHESAVPQAFIDKGFLDHMTNFSHITQEEKDRPLICKAFVSGGNDDEYYCI